MNTKFLAAAAGIALVSSPAAAQVTVGGFTFDNNAFVDSLTGSSGSYSVSGGSLASAVTDIDAGTYAFSFSQGAYLDLAFTDNIAVNLAGNDIVLFELGVPDPFEVTINGITQTYGTLGTGFSAGGFNLNAAAFDLSDFGLSLGSTVSSLRLAFPNNGTIASTSLVGALNSRSVRNAVPEPATWAMMLLGFGLVGSAMRRRQKVTYRFA